MRTALETFEVCDVFATEAGSTVNLSKVTIKATGEGGHGVMATNGGVMTLTDVDLTTAGPHSGAIATDRGGGAITATGGTVTTTGQDSPGIYSTGAITVTGGAVSATGSESALEAVPEAWKYYFTRRRVQQEPGRGRCR